MTRRRVSIVCCRQRQISEDGQTGEAPKHRLRAKGCGCPGLLRRLGSGPPGHRGPPQAGLADGRARRGHAATAQLRCDLCIALFGARLPGGPGAIHDWRLPGAQQRRLVRVSRARCAGGVQGGCCCGFTGSAVLRIAGRPDMRVGHLVRLSALSDEDGHQHDPSQCVQPEHIDDDAADLWIQ